MLKKHTSTLGYCKLYANVHLWLCSSWQQQKKITI